ncbi:flagellar motor switch protein FliN [Pararhizobium mangrovi]|uniref:Flagellar motor switch protein FliN n=1 Tax=Pararhizobium mangrovi TaxID=2590452 RepID=A0A506TWA4_9HYPH|nr:flagellar motor switch protein FliN [Pararhizobium mangrovi]TPW25760.1 flagellar motor switch protein FliN [Pararhizobium mangrovi]
MTSDNAAEAVQDTTKPDEVAANVVPDDPDLEPGAGDAELDEAIGELRGVLKKDAEGLGDEGAAPAAASAKHMDGRNGMSARAASEETFADFGTADEAHAGDDAASAIGRPSHMGRIKDIPVDVEVLLGTSRMPVSALMQLGEGSTIALDRKIGEPVEITVNGHLLGHGEITVLDEDESRFGIRLIDLVGDKG